MNEDQLEQAVRQLTEPWTHTIRQDNKWHTIEHPPRLVMLNQAIRSSIGGTTPGRTNAAERSILNLTALTLWQRIEEQTQATLAALGKQPPRHLTDALNTLGNHGDTLRHSNNITERDHHRLVTRITQWRDDIDNIFDPPTTKELTAPCPKCGTDYVNLDDGRTHALIAYYWRDHEPAARCQGCETIWQGQRELLQLGYSISANIDHQELATMNAG